MRDKVDDSELVSALADGQLDAMERSRALVRLAQEPEQQLNWHAYHLVGDVLRGGESVLGDREGQFLQRLTGRLAKERIGIDPNLGPLVMQPVTVDRAALAAVAVNDPVFYRRAAGALAGVVAVAFAAWVLVQAGAGADTAAQLAHQGQITPQALPPQAAQLTSATEGDGGLPVMIRDPRLDALMAAHQQMAVSSALQAPTGFVRNATLTGADR